MKITSVNFVFTSLGESVFTFYLLAPTLSSTKSLATTFFIFLLVNSSILLVHKLVLYPFFFSPLRHFPEAKGFLPILGHVMILFQRPGGETHLRMMKETQNDGIILTRGFFHSDRLSK